MQSTNSPNSDDLIDGIEEIRAKNNSYWMDILRIAMKHAPEETRQKLKWINTCDQAIALQLKKLSEDPDE